MENLIVVITKEGEEDSIGRSLGEVYHLIKHNEAPYGQPHFYACWKEISKARNYTRITDDQIIEVLKALVQVFRLTKGDIAWNSCPKFQEWFE
ncbi:MAG: hypothetical protein ACYTFW_16900 [Planctomycetota bacterium]|jgi:hypothetical protein